MSSSEITASCIMAPGSIEMNFIKINSSCLEGVREMTKRRQTPPFPYSLTAEKEIVTGDQAKLKGHEKRI